jgi:SurA N-terminal domain
MPRKTILAVSMLAVLAVAGGIIGYRYTASSQVQYALKVNGTTYSPGDVATRVARAQRIASASAHAPGTHTVGNSAAQVVQSLINEALELQEAQRRGISCSQTEAHDQQATFVAGAVSGGQTQAILIAAVGVGIVPAGYLDLPEAQRTPATNGVIAAYLSSTAEYDPNGCIIGKLFGQVRQGAAGGDPIGDLQRRLLAAATIQGPALTPTASEPATPTILVGAPSLTGGTVQVPVSTDGSGFAPYSGFSVHLRWSSSVFTYASASNTGTLIPSPFCPNPIVDSDGAGVTYACTSTSGSVTTTGLLATIVLTPAASGCSPLHLFTFGAPDGGAANDGTYTVDADTNAPQATAYVDGSASVAGQVC